MDSKLKGSLAADRVSVQGAIVFAIVLFAIDQIWLQGAKSRAPSIYSRLAKSAISRCFNLFSKREEN